MRGDSALDLGESRILDIGRVFTKGVEAVSGPIKSPSCSRILRIKLKPDECPW